MKEGWEIKKLRELYDVQSSKRVHKKDWQSEGVPFYRAREVVKLAKNGFVENELFISEELFNEFTKDKGAPKEDDIIISAVGTLGQCYLVQERDKFYIKDASVLWLSKKSDVSSRYIEYSFKSPSIQEQVLERSMGATVGTLTISRAKNIKIPLPPLREQQRIVCILDRAFAAIDQAKANAEKNLQNAKELFESNLQGVFENQGEGWEEKKLKEIGLTQTGNTPKTSEKENYGDYIPFIKPADVDYTGIGDLRYDNNRLSEIGFKKARTMKSGSTLMVCIGATIGKVGFAEHDVTSNQQINSLTVNNEYHPKFFYYAMTSRVFQEKVLSAGKGAQATLPIINKSKWENLTIPFPILKSEQEYLTERFDALRSETQKLETLYQKKITALD